MELKNPGIGKRHFLAIWMFTGLTLEFMLRGTLNVAIVSMANSTTAEHSEEGNHTDTCPYPGSDNETSLSRNPPEFYWDHGTQGFILSSFYYGYLVTQILGGYIAKRYGARFVMVFGVGGDAVFTLLTPLAARFDPIALVTIRVLQGFTEVFYTC